MPKPKPRRTKRRISDYDDTDESSWSADEFPKVSIAPKKAKSESETIKDAEPEVNVDQGDSVNVFEPLYPVDLVISKLLGYLNLDDLLSCRRVLKDLNNTLINSIVPKCLRRAILKNRDVDTGAYKIQLCECRKPLFCSCSDNLRSKGGRRRFLLTSNAEVAHQLNPQFFMALFNHFHLQNMEANHPFVKECGDKITSLQLDFIYGFKRAWILLESFMKLLSMFPNLKHLELGCSISSDRYVEQEKGIDMFNGNLNLEHLESVKITFVEGHVGVFILKTILNATPILEKLALDQVYLDAPELSQLICSSLAVTNGTLASIEITGTEYTYHNDILQELPSGSIKETKLKFLDTPAVKDPVFPPWLIAQFDSLETLHFSFDKNKEPRVKTFRFDLIPQLKELSIDCMGNGEFQFLTAFPKLQVLKVDMYKTFLKYEHNSNEPESEEESTVNFENVHTLILYHPPVEKVKKTFVANILKTFPRLSCLTVKSASFNFHDQLISSLQFYESLRKLHLDFDNMSEFDITMLITGLTKKELEGCHKKRKMDDNDNNAPRSQGLGDLRQLTHLDLFTFSGREITDMPLEVLKGMSLTSLVLRNFRFQWDTLNVFQTDCKFKPTIWQGKFPYAPDGETDLQKYTFFKNFIKFSKEPLDEEYYLHLINGPKTQSRISLPIE